MDEEMLLSLTEAIVEPETLTNPEQRLQELTPEIAASAPVVNSARPQGRMQGVTNFLANPEVQMAMAAFAKAFTKNDPNAAGTILANAAEGTVRERSNQRALEAAEGGQKIAEVAGRFASPELVAQLQQNRELVQLQQQRNNLSEQELQQQAEQFEVQTGFEERLTRLREIGQAQDFGLSVAAAQFDIASFNRRADLLEREANINERVAEKNMEYTDFLMGQGAQNNENFALRTNEYLEVLGEQEAILKEDLNQINDMIEDLDALWINRDDVGFFRSDAVSSGIREVEASGLPTPDPRTRNNTRDALQQLYRRKQEKLASHKAMIESLQAAQTARLGGTPVSGSEGGITDEQAQAIDAQNRPTPQRIATASAARQYPVGTVLQFNGVVFERVANGVRRIGTVDEYNQTTTGEE